ncbi:hypothetical protein [Flammeovirga sp. SubArs3]|uniref:hypothetical protein n=1 Tax=Flammeovirga sp. SubArs3 TaxID=2995316 RepID=UPI00248C918E|nr:hypothetical protein [Flammeovirga sp. SubArs3]
MMRTLFFLLFFTVSAYSQNIDVYPIKVTRNFLATCGNQIPKTSQMFLEKQVKLSLKNKDGEYHVEVYRLLNNGQYRKVYELKYGKLLTSEEKEYYTLHQGKGAFFTSDNYFEGYHDSIIEFTIHQFKPGYRCDCLDEPVVLFTFSMFGKSIVMYVRQKELEQNKFLI